VELPMQHPPLGPSNGIEPLSLPTMVGSAIELRRSPLTNQ